MQLWSSHMFHWQYSCVIPIRADLCTISVGFLKTKFQNCLGIMCIKKIILGLHEKKCRWASYI